MANYRTKSTGEPVKVGDMITTTKEKKTTFGLIKSTESVLVTESIIPVLIKQGIIEEVTINENTSTIIINDDISYYVNKLAEQFDTTTDKMADILDKMNKVCPKSTLSLLLKSISDEYCKVECKRISQHKGFFWYISTVDGSVNKLDKAPSNWDHLTLFKEKKYALNALCILKEQMNFMYGK